MRKFKKGADPKSKLYIEHEDGKELIGIQPCENMLTLRKWLTAMKIAWWDNSRTYDDDFYIHRTKFMIANKEYSVINGYGTYGGFYDVSKNNLGLLEMYVSGEGDPVGYLNAKETIDKICEISGLIDTAFVWKL